MQFSDLQSYYRCRELDPESASAIAAEHAADMGVETMRPLLLMALERWICECNALKLDADHLARDLIDSHRGLAVPQYGRKARNGRGK